MTAGNIIRKLRIENTYTQSQLAEMLNIKLSTLQKYESGAILNIKLDTIRKICNIFQILPSILIFPDNLVIEISKNTEICEVYNVKHMIEFNRLFLSLNYTGRNKAISYLKDLHHNKDYLY